MSNIEEDLRQVLLKNGADMVGFADLRAVGETDLPFGVSVVVALSPQVVKSIPNGPTLEYYNEYHRLNDKLDRIVTAGALYLQGLGYKATANTVDSVVEYDGYRTKMPDKTVATRAGLGWIGKCALFVTHEYGSACRLSSITTNAPLKCGTPVTSSKCGGCTRCKDACPAKAVSGNLWDATKDRDTFFNPYLCRKAARILAKDKINKEITLCGKCIAACPYTQKYISNT